MLTGDEQGLPCCLESESLHRPLDRWTDRSDPGVPEPREDELHSLPRPVREEVGEWQSEPDPRPGGGGGGGSMCVCFCFFVFLWVGGVVKRR